MSTRLQRAIRRARGQLPAAQPLVPSRFAPHPGVEAASLPAGIELAVEPSSAPASGHHGEQVNEQVKAGARESEQSSPPRRERGSMPASAEQAPALVTARLTRAGRQGAAAGARVPVSAERDAIVRRDDGSVDARIGETPAAGVQSVSVSQQSSIGVARGASSQATPLAAAAAMPSANEVSLTRANRRSQGSRARVSESADAQVSGPEVTISIGHIEVNAPPVAAAIAAPAPSPFKPRVPLEDFLARQRARPR